MDPPSGPHSQGLTWSTYWAPLPLVPLSKSGDLASVPIPPAEASLTEFARAYGPEPLSVAAQRRRERRHAAAVAKAALSSSVRAKTGGSNSDKGSEEAISPRSAGNQSNFPVSGEPLVLSSPIPLSPSPLLSLPLLSNPFTALQSALADTLASTDTRLGSAIARRRLAAASAALSRSISRGLAAAGQIAAVAGVFPQWTRFSALHPFVPDDTAHYEALVETLLRQSSVDDGLQPLKDGKGKGKAQEVYQEAWAEQQQQQQQVQDGYLPASPSPSNQNQNQQSLEYAPPSPIVAPNQQGQRQGQASQGAGLRLGVGLGLGLPPLPPGSSPAILSAGFGVGEATGGAATLASPSPRPALLLAQTEAAATTASVLVHLNPPALAAYLLSLHGTLVAAAAVTAETVARIAGATAAAAGAGAEGASSEFSDPHSSSPRTPGSSGSNKNGDGSDDSASDFSEHSLLLPSPSTLTLATTSLTRASLPSLLSSLRLLAIRRDRAVGSLLQLWRGTLAALRAQAVFVAAAAEELHTARARARTRADGLGQGQGQGQESSLFNSDGCLLIKPLSSSTLQRLALSPRAVAVAGWRADPSAGPALDEAARALPLLACRVANGLEKVWGEDVWAGTSTNAAATTAFAAATAAVAAATASTVPAGAGSGGSSSGSSKRSAAAAAASAARALSAVQGAPLPPPSVARARRTRALCAAAAAAAAAAGAEGWDPRHGLARAGCASGDVLAVAAEAAAHAAAMAVAASDLESIASKGKGKGKEDKGYQGEGSGVLPPLPPSFPTPAAFAHGHLASPAAHAFALLRRLLLDERCDEGRALAALSTRAGAAGAEIAGKLAAYRRAAAAAAAAATPTPSSNGTAPAPGASNASDDVCDLMVRVLCGGAGADTLARPRSNVSASSGGNGAAGNGNGGGQTPLENESDCVYALSRLVAATARDARALADAVVRRNGVPTRPIMLPRPLEQALAQQRMTVGNDMDPDAAGTAVIVVAPAAIVRACVQMILWPQLWQVIMVPLWGITASTRNSTFPTGSSSLLSPSFLAPSAKTPIFMPATTSGVSFPTPKGGASPSPLMSPFPGNSLTPATPPLAPSAASSSSAAASALARLRAHGAWVASLPATQLGAAPEHLPPEQSMSPLSQQQQQQQHAAGKGFDEAVATLLGRLSENQQEEGPEGKEGNENPPSDAAVGGDNDAEGGAGPAGLGGPREPDCAPPVLAADDVAAAARSVYAAMRANAKAHAERKSSIRDVLGMEGGMKDGDHEGSQPQKKTAASDADMGADAFFPIWLHVVARAAAEAPSLAARAHLLRVTLAANAAAHNAAPTVARVAQGGNDGDDDEEDGGGWRKGKFAMGDDGAGEAAYYSTSLQGALAVLMQPFDALQSQLAPRPV